MQIFKDKNGKQRKVELTVKNLEDMRSGLNFRDGEPVDLYQISDEFNELFGNAEPAFEFSPTLEKLISEQEVICQVVHVAMDCDFEEFASGMNGKAIADATQALIREIIHFFFPLRESVMIAAFEKICDLEKENDKSQAKLIQRMEPEESVKFLASAKRSGKSPEDSALTPDH